MIWRIAAAWPACLAVPRSRGRSAGTRLAPPPPASGESTWRAANEAGIFASEVRDSLGGAVRRRRAAVVAA